MGNGMILFILGVFEELLIKLDVLTTVHHKIVRLGIIVFILSAFHCIVIQQLAIDPKNRILVLLYSTGSAIGAMITVKLYNTIRQWSRHRKILKSLEKARIIRWENYRDFTEYEQGKIDTGNEGEGR
jgi:predicted membrane channel-forming protein YqfA (hemolysin III family)